MDAALRAMVDDALRPAGFSGSLPHLRRDHGDRIDLISFQFFSSGGSFVAEIACSPPDGITGARGWIPGSEVHARNISRPRPRLGSPTFPVGDHWFVFGPRNYEEPSADGYQSPAELASEVARLIRAEADPWWATKPFPKAR